MPKPIVAIIQARMTSTRLPGKVLADLCGEPVLKHMLDRAAQAERLSAIWVATTSNATDDPVAALCEAEGVPVFRGDEADVLGRYAAVAEEAHADVVMRLTADCPMIDPQLIDQAVEEFSAGGFDYYSNALQRTYPDGLDIEVFTREALDEANRKATLPFQREHVTPYLRTGLYDDIPTGDFAVGHMMAPGDFSHLRWTVDTREDLRRVRALVSALPADYRWLDVIALLTRRPELLGDSETVPVDIDLRPVGADDAELLFGWVNRPDSLANKLRTADPISREDHELWFQDRLSSDDAAIWIAEQDQKPVGQLRLERRDEALEVDVYVDPAVRGKGVGVAMLEAARREAGRRWPGTPLLARIRADNWASRRLFARAGYGKMTVGPDHVVVHRDALECGRPAA